MNLFLLPGNPPALHFYELWAHEIREKIPGARVEVARYPLRIERGDSTAFFERLVDDVSSQYLAYLAQTKGPASLVGHSLGGYVALKLLSRIPDRVETCHLLHPFLRRPALSGRAILKLGSTVASLPSAHKWFLRIKPMIGLFLNAAHKLTDEEIRVFAELVHHEHLSIGQDLSSPAISSELRRKVCVYSTPGDRWCPPETVASLGEGIRHVTGPGRHDFVVRRSDRDLLFEHLQIP